MAYSSVYNTGKGVMKVAGNFKLSFSYFSPDHNDFSHVIVAMGYS